MSVRQGWLSVPVPSPPSPRPSGSPQSPSTQQMTLEHCHPHGWHGMPKDNGALAPGRGTPDSRKLYQALRIQAAAAVFFLSSPSKGAALRFLAQLSP